MLLVLALSIIAGYLAVRPRSHSSVTSLPPPGQDCAAYAARDSVIAGQAALIRQLQDRVQRLERELSRNSGNSSMPPSTDDQPGKKPPERKPRRRSGRKQRENGTASPKVRYTVVRGNRTWIPQPDHIWADRITALARSGTK